MIAVDASTIQAWSAVAIAVLTAALVGVSIAYVILTARLADYAKNSAESAERSLLLESMPIVLPEAGSGSRSGGQTNIHVNLINTGRHTAINGAISVRGKGEFFLGPQAVPPLPSGESIRQAFVSREETFPMWNEGALTEYTISIEYQDPVGNRYRVEHSLRKGISNNGLTRYRNGDWEALASPRN